MEWIANPQAWVALATLTALEIVLGVDNIVFISILVGRLPAHRRDKARTLGLALAMVTRILLLLTLTWIMTLITPLFNILGREISGRDLILICGGLFLLAKSTHEIHANLEGTEESGGKKAKRTFISVLVQIAILDIVFSLESVITAVGFCGQSPHHQDHGFELSFTSRIFPHGRGFGPAYSQRIYLLCYGFFTYGRSSQPASARADRQTGQAAQACFRMISASVILLRSFPDDD